MPETKTWVEKAVTEYNRDKKSLQKYRDGLNLDKQDDQMDSDMVDEMIGDLNFALNWMQTGRRPGNRRGVESKGVYKRTALLDRNQFPSLNLEEEEKEISEEARRKIADMLWKMTSRERTCYLLHVSYGLSFADIGKELKLSRYTVKTFIQRAKKKIFS